MNRTRGLLWAVSLALCLAACRSFNKLSNENLAPNYDYRETYLHPDYTLFHENDTATTLYIRVPKAELLFKRNEADQQTASARITWALNETFEAKAPFDSASQVFANTTALDDYLVYRIDFKTPRKTFVVSVTLDDLYRKKGITDCLLADKRSAQAAQRFLLIPAGVKAPLFRNYVRGDEPFRCYRPGEQIRRMTVRCYFRDFPVAPPPFSSHFPVQFNYAADSLYTIDVGPETVLRLPRNGMYHFQYDTTVKAGLTVFRYDSDFPKVTAADELVESLRYLTTNREYDKLRAAGDAKEAIDAFWLELAGNQDRARTLIRKYYTRIQEANRLFTSYLEGWKTDRGLIFTVMGPPTSVFRTSDSEEWTYGNYNDASAITFSFEHIYNPFSPNDYILRRSDFYEQVWYRMVDRWRQGVVVND